MNLIDIYNNILEYSGMEADKDGFISNKVKDKRLPATVDGKRLVLPLNNQLRNFNNDELMLFHPLSENIIKGESPIIKKLKSAINIKLNYTIGIIASNLLNIVASPELHSNLNPEQAKLLTIISDVDTKTVLNFNKEMVSTIDNAPEKAFVNIFLNRGGRIGDKKYSKLGVVSFPFYNGIDKLKIRVKDKNAYKELFEFIFPTITEEDSYNYGSNNRIAPFLDALMLTSATIASRLNDLLNTYQDLIEDADMLMFNDDWIEYFDDLEELRSEIRKIPSHSAVTSMETSQEPISQNSIQQPGYPQQPMQQPGYPQQPMQQPGYPQQPMQQPGYPQQPMQQPGYPQQPTQQNTVIKDKDGIDFRSFMQANPHLAAGPNPFVSQFPGNAMAQAVPPGQQPMINQWGLPVLRPASQVQQYMANQQAQQPPVNQWGQPLQQAPVDQWGQPLQQPGYPQRQF